MPPSPFATFYQCHPPIYAHKTQLYPHTTRWILRSHEKASEELQNSPGYNHSSGSEAMRRGPPHRDQLGWEEGAPRSSSASNYTARTLPLSRSARLTNEIQKLWVLSTGIWQPFISLCLKCWYVPLREGLICNIKINLLHENETGQLSQLFRYSCWTTCYGHPSPCTVEKFACNFWLSQNFTNSLLLTRSLTNNMNSQLT